MTVTGPDGLQYISPEGPVTAYKTYSYYVRQRKATCVEVDCPAYLHGWKTIVPAGSQMEATIRNLKGHYRWTEQRQEGDLIEFVFEPGQQCFASYKPFPLGHTLPWEGHERFVERGGDWRAVTSEPYIHVRADDWIDSFATHQINVVERISRG
jgi:hypothetical protein